MIEGASKQQRGLALRFVAVIVIAIASASATSSNGAFSLIVPATFAAAGGECGGSRGYWDCLISAAGSVPALYDGGVVIVSRATDAPFDAALGEAINSTRGAADQVRAQTLHMSAATANHNRPTDRWSSVFGRRRLEVVGVVDASVGPALATAQARHYAANYNVTGIYVANMSATNIAAAAQQQNGIDTIAAVRSVWGHAIFVVCEFDSPPVTSTLLTGASYCNVAIVHNAPASTSSSVPSVPTYLQAASFDRDRIARVYTSATSSASMRAAVRAVQASLPRAGYTFVTDLDRFVVSQGEQQQRLPVYWTGLLAEVTRPWARYGPAHAAGINVHVPTETALREPRYLSVARTATSLLKNQPEGVNVYGNRPTYLSLDTGNVTARTQCSSFITRLWQLTYNISASHFYRWFRSTSPLAEDYHDAIVNGTGFVRLYSVHDLMPGDIVAMRYPLWDRNGITGHAMIVVNVSKRSSDKSPIVAGTEQYDMWVIDSSASYHGSSDTRAPPNRAGGIGMGISRVFASASANYSAGQHPLLVRTVGGFNATLPVEAAIAGYTWSDFSNSRFYSNEAGASRTLVFGRPTFLEMFDADTAASPSTGGNPPASTATSSATAASVLSTASLALVTLFLGVGVF